MREKRIKELKSIFVRAHEIDEIISEEQLIGELISYWLTSRYEIEEIISTLVYENFIFYFGRKGRRRFWLNPEKYFPEMQQSAYF